MSDLTHEDWPWQSAKLGDEVDFSARHVTYHGPNGESYVESSPEVKV